MPLIEDLSKRVDTHDAVIADLVRSIRAIVAGAGKTKSPLLDESEFLTSMAIQTAVELRLCELQYPANEPLAEVQGRLA